MTPSDSARSNSRSRAVKTRSQAVASSMSVPILSAVLRHSSGPVTKSKELMPARAQASMASSERRTAVSHSSGSVVTKSCGTESWPTSRPWAWLSSTSATRSLGSWVSGSKWGIPQSTDSAPACLSASRTVAGGHLFMSPTTM